MSPMMESTTKMMNSTPGHIVASFEHVAHRCDVIEHDRNCERDGVRDKIGNAEELGERHHEPVVDQKRDHAHDAELHELRDELFHSPLFVHARPEFNLL